MLSSVLTLRISEIFFGKKFNKIPVRRDVYDGVRMGWLLGVAFCLVLAFAGYMSVMPVSLPEPPLIKVYLMFSHLLIVGMTMLFGMNILGKEFNPANLALTVRRGER